MSASKNNRLPGSSTNWLQGGARSSLLVIGDGIAYYAALILTLMVRYGGLSLSSNVFYIHRYAFTVGLALWLIVFFIGGLYERTIVLRNVLDRRFFALVGIGGLLLISMFYFVPSFGITPKTTLLIFIGMEAVIGYAWRMCFNLAVRSSLGTTALRVMIIGSSVAADELASALSQNHSHGYALAYWLKEGLTNYQDPERFLSDIKQQRVDAIVIPQNLEHDPAAVKLLYTALLSGVSIVPMADFYERIFEKVSLAILDEVWLIRNLADRRPRYRIVRRFTDILLSVLLLIIFSPIMALIAIIVPLSSQGAPLYKQPRIGFNNRVFLLRKFRSMYSSIEKNPDAQGQAPTWSTGSQDHRVTPFGRFLRSSHLDELPQLINILRGEMSFVGPRPERPFFTEKLEKTIPYYTLRHLVRPGIAGWAQLLYPYGDSVEDAYQKLQYDMYYIKHRSLWFDLTIFLKTIKRLFVQAEQSS